MHVPEDSVWRNASWTVRCEMSEAVCTALVRLGSREGRKMDEEGRTHTGAIGASGAAARRGGVLAGHVSCV